MIGTNLQRKRSEHGASLILLVSIIGLAFIMTVAASLVAASYSQDRARLASAKMDVATREDALMREILQQTATGMLPGTNGVTGPILTWTAIMTNAANNLRATSYVDPAELAALPGLAGVIPANLGDTAGTLLGIFNGYNREVPFGGTSGLANNVSLSNANNATAQPPLMNWSGGTTLSSATALTTPQEFFLGSLNTAGALAQSIGNRWAQLTYPNIRFGYKQPGTPFVARRVWWCIPLVYQPAQPKAEYQAGTDPASANSYPSAQANYVLSVYEIPSQLPISGNANLQIGADTSGTAWDPTKISVIGSISGNQITLSGGSYSGVSSRQQVYVVNPATVAGVAYSSDSTGSAFDQPGTREQLALTQTPGAAAPVSVVGNDGKALLVPVMPGNDFYMAAPGTPTHWDLYARPYYRCRIRVIISGTDSTIIYSPNQTPTTNPAAGAITVQIIVLPDPSSSPDQILGFPDSAATYNKTFTQTSSADPNSNLPSYLNYTSTATGDRNILVIDVGNMVATLGGGTLAKVAPQLYSIYIGSNPTTEPDAPSTPSDPGVAITDTKDLSAFTSGLSIVTNQTLYLLDSFNQVTPVPTSLYAPQVRYGISPTNLQANLTGQVAMVATPGPSPVNPLSFTNVNGGSIGSSNTSAALTDLTNPTKPPWTAGTTLGIPPITALNLLFTIEKERTN
jgi:hypothetical protein